MKKNNPNIPILIREATGIEPKVWARYGMKGIRQIVQKLTAGRLWQGVIKTFVRCANSATAMKDLLLTDLPQDFQIKRSRTTSQN
jgi:hypothetical protein